MTLEAENLHLKAKLSLLEEQFSLLQANLAAQQHLNTLLTQKVKCLEDLLAQNSHNSSKPPSSDGFKKPSLSPRPPKNRSLRKASGKKSGGQKGHEAHSLAQTANPDYLLDHLPSACHACHSDLTRQTPLLVERRQVFEIPLLKLKVSEHRTYQKACLRCKATTIAPFPSDVKHWVQYGSHFRALAVWLNQVQLLPYARTVEVINELFGEECSFSQGTLALMLAECYHKLAQPSQAIKVALSRSQVAHCDETGGRVEGKLHWFHVFSTKDLTHYECHKKRGKLAIDEIGILGQFRGVAVHDGWASYAGYSCEHALCNAHHLRELTFVEEQLAQSWAGDFKQLLLEIKDEVEFARTQGQHRLEKAVLAKYEFRYQKLLLVGLEANPPPITGWAKGKAGRKKQSKAKNLLDRLHTHRREVLAFGYDFRVPFDNNQAERDLRMVKVQQKIAGCFRTQSGAAIFCRIRGYISSMKKQGKQTLQALYQVFKGQPLNLDLA